MFCSNCGKEIENISKFCSNCGNKTKSNTDLEDALNASKEKIEVVTEFVKKKTADSISNFDKENISNLATKSKEKISIKLTKKTLIGIVILLILGGILGSFAVLSSPKRTLNKYIESIKDLNIEKAMKYTNAESIAGKKELADYIAEMRDEMQSNLLEAKMAFSNLKILDSKILHKDGDSCILTVTMIMDGDIDTDNIYLVKEGGKWKIDIRENDILRLMY